MGNADHTHMPECTSSSSRWVRAAGNAGDDALQGSSVLVVDDNTANVALLSRLLHRAGVQDVHTVTDPREAVDRWLETQPDLVLLDLQMPDMDGLSVMAALRERAPADAFVPVLVLTADTTAQTRERALRAGANDFLAKPFDRVEVVLRVRNLLQTARLYSVVYRHNAHLRAELADRAEQERREAAARAQIGARIDAVIGGGRLTSVFQPIVDLSCGAVPGVEALARFAAEPVRAPNEWFDDAARIGRGVELELAAIDVALRHVHRLPAGTFMSLNASPATASAPALLSALAGVPGDRVVLELTEHERVADYPSLLDALADLRATGVRIAVDDTGAGFAGLRHLLHVRPDIVKLDVGLTRDIDSDPGRRALAAGLVTFAAEIGAVVVAEGIETAAELRALRDLHVQWGQGYHLARPQAVETAVRPLDLARRGDR